MHELDTTISQKSPDKYLESATSRTIDVIKHGLEHQNALSEVADNANKMRETLRVYESKIRSLEFELGREKGAHVLGNSASSCNQCHLRCRKCLCVAK